MIRTITFLLLFCLGSALHSQTPGNVCSDANAIDSLMGQTQNVPQLTGLLSNIGYTSTGDPAVGFECFWGGDGLQNTIWFSFTGDGYEYRFRTVQCNATTYIPDGDTQVAVYSGDCANLTPVACNDDEDEAGGVYNFKLELNTQAGVDYFMLIDGWGEAVGQFCLEITNLSEISSVAEINELGVSIFPNPTSGLIELQGVQPRIIRVVDSFGRQAMLREGGQPQIDLSHLPGGVYTLLLGMEDGTWGSAKVVKQ